MPVTTVAATEPGSQSSDQTEITDDLVREVAGIVFRLLMLELRIESERRQQPRQGMPFLRGGWLWR